MGHTSKGREAPPQTKKIPLLVGSVQQVFTDQTPLPPLPNQWQGTERIFKIMYTV